MQLVPLLAITISAAMLADANRKVDCYKNRVALEVEWNNKPPFFDRDLNIFRLICVRSIPESSSPDGRVAENLRV